MDYALLIHHFKQSFHFEGGGKIKVYLSRDNAEVLFSYIYKKIKRVHENPGPRSINAKLVGT